MVPVEKFEMFGTTASLMKTHPVPYPYDPSTGSPQTAPVITERVPVDPVFGSSGMLILRMFVDTDEMALPVYVTHPIWYTNPVAVCELMSVLRLASNVTRRFPVEVKLADTTEGWGIISATSVPVVLAGFPTLRESPIMATYAVYSHPERGFQRLSFITLFEPVQTVVVLSNTEPILTPVKLVPVGSI